MSKYVVRDSDVRISKNKNIFGKGYVPNKIEKVIAI